jgi:hypothetical protein
MNNKNPFKNIFWDEEVIEVKGIRYYLYCFFVFVWRENDSKLFLTILQNNDLPTLLLFLKIAEQIILKQNKTKLLKKTVEMVCPTTWCHWLDHNLKIFVWIEQFRDLSIVNIFRILRSILDSCFVVFCRIFYFFKA